MTIWDIWDVDDHTKSTATSRQYVLVLKSKHIIAWLDELHVYLESQVIYLSNYFIIGNQVISPASHSISTPQIPLNSLTPNRAPLIEMHCRHIPLLQPIDRLRELLSQSIHLLDLPNWIQIRLESKDQCL